MNERNLERPTNHEQEPKPKVLVTFLGMQHLRFNLEFISTLENTLTTRLEQPFGKKVIYYEANDIKDSEADFYKRLQKKYGGLANVQIASYLRLKHGTMPSPQTVANYRQNLDTEEDITSIVEEDLLPVNNLMMWNFYLYRSLENLQSQYKLELIHESHRGPTVDKALANSKESDREILAAYSAWNNKGFDEAIEHTKRSVQLDIQHTSIRDLEIVDLLKKKVKTLAKEPQGASLVIIFGASHASILEEVQRKLGSNFPAVFELITLNSIGTAIRLSLKKGETISDELYAQYLAERMIIDETYQTLLKTGKTRPISKNYEKFLTCIDKICHELTIQELRRFCEEKVHLVQFVKNHPSAEPIKEIFD